MRGKKEWVVRLAVIAVAAAFYLFFGCPIRRLTGCACPGCGMSRALAALLRLDFSGAWHFHPLIFLMPAFALAFFLTRKSAKAAVKVSLCLAFCLVAVYLWRLLAHTAPDVVFLRPEEGLILQTVDKLRSVLHGCFQKLFSQTGR